MILRLLATAMCVGLAVGCTGNNPASPTAPGPTGTTPLPAPPQPEPPAPSPTDTTPPAPEPDPVPESYVGTYRITDCGGDCVLGTRDWPLGLTVTWSGDRPSATLRTEPWGLEVTLEGRPDGTDRFKFAGEANPRTPFVTRAEFDATLEKRSDKVTGSFTYRVDRPSAPSLTVRADIKRLDSGDNEPRARDFSGTWSLAGSRVNQWTSETGFYPTLAGLVLKRRGSGYAGLVQLKAAGTYHHSIPVTGRVTNGTLLLEGSLDVPVDSLRQELRLGLRFLPSGDLAGDYALRQAIPTYSVTEYGALHEPTRRLPDVRAGEITGDWHGLVLQDVCTGECDFDTGGELRVTLRRVGSHVEVVDNPPYTLHARMEGTTLILEGEGPLGGPGCLTRSGDPCRWSERFVITGIDEWGMMTGTGAIARHSQYSSKAIEGRLWNVARQIVKWP